MSCTVCQTRARVSSSPLHDMDQDRGQEGRRRIVPERIVVGGLAHMGEHVRRHLAVADQGGPWRSSSSGLNRALCAAVGLKMNTGPNPPAAVW